MAWSWLRRRADRPSGTAPATTQPPAARGVRRIDDWQELPAVQRTLEPLSPVAPLDAFTNGLAAHQNPSFLAPLGHRVDPDGPGGLVTGLASVRPGNPIPYAASTALAVPASRKPRPAVQRHAITWSTVTAAQPAESSTVDLSDATPIEEIPTAEPGSALGTTPDIRVDEVVTPVPPSPPPPPAAAAGAAAAASSVPSVARVAPTAGPGASTQPTPAGPVPTTEPTLVPIDLPEPGAEPASATATEVVTPEPPQAGASDAPVAPLLGSAPDPAITAGETAGAVESAPTASPERTTLLPVSRLAAVAGTAQPTPTSTANAQPPEAQVVEPARQRPTISSSTPVPSLQRQLSAVPEGHPRTSAMPPPFTVELPVVARTGPEPPTTAPPPDRAMDVGPTIGGPTAGGGLPTNVPTSGPPVIPTSIPQPGPAAELPLVGRPGPEPVAATSGPEPASANPESATRSIEPDSPRSEQTPTAPLSGFAARIASLTNPTEAAGSPQESGQTIAAPSLQRLAGPGAPLHHPTSTQAPESQLATPAVAPPDSPEPRVIATEPLVVPTVGAETPLVQRTAHHPADLGAVPSADPVPPVSGLTAAVDRPLTPVTTPPGRDLSLPTSGSASAPGIASPTVARLAAPDSSPTSHAYRPDLETVTAALVSHRPPLAVRSDLSSAVAPPETVQRVSFTGPGEPSAAYRSTATAAVQRTPARIGDPVPSRTTESPAGPDPVRQAAADDPPMVLTSVMTGHAEGHRETISVQRQSPLPAMPARSPQVPPATGATRSFAAMFDGDVGGQPAEDADGHPGYTTVQLQTAAESPPPDESAAAPAAAPPAETAAPASAAAAAASPGAPPTAGAAAAQLDEMARQLFEPLSARLRAELWLDRERAGLVSDARH